MASRPNPSWTEPQKAKFKHITDAIEIAIPYFGPEIPVLDNHTTQQLVDETGVIKEAKRAFETVEKSLVVRLKARMEGNELRGTRFEATLTGSIRTALDQEKVKTFLQECDNEGIDIRRLMEAIINGRLDVPDDVRLIDNEEEGGESNLSKFMSDTDVETLKVKAL